MEIGKIIKIKQPDVYRTLLKMANKQEIKYMKTDDDLTTEDFERMMRHDSYKRIGGSVRQVRHG